MKNCELSSNEFYKRFIKIFPEFKKWTDKEIIIIKQFIKKDDIILDIGCGWGREIKLLAPICKKIIGIDIDPQEIDYAKSYLNQFKNIGFFVKDASKTNFPEGYFDVIIIMGNTFGNLGKKKLAVLKETKRLVKKNGMVLISIYQKIADQKRILAYKKMGFNITLHNEKIKLDNAFISESFDKQELEQIFINLGFKVRFIDLNSIAILCILIKK